MNGKHDLKTISKLFQIDGIFLHAVPYGTGHINDTYLVTLAGTAGDVRCVFQRVNHHVFTQPVQVMDNIERVTAHIEKKLRSSGVDDLHRRVLRLIPALDGSTYAFDSDGNLWRAYYFIDEMVVYEVAETPAQVFEVGRAFGDFQKLLMDLSPDDLHETIPYFHHTRRRLLALQEAIQADPFNRAVGIKDEINFVMNREPLADALLSLEASGQVPTRVIHNDTKMNNLLVDQTTARGMCVTDLDTTMPGLSLYDFGDMVRTATVTAAEDERDLSKVEMRVDMFQALVDGYLTEADMFLTNAERANLVTSGKVITLEIGMRFLTDYLQGDKYFKISRPSHNLDRARAQFKLVSSMEAHEQHMRSFVERWHPNGFSVKM